MVDPAASALFSRLREAEPENRRCCDTGSSDAQWASISHGIFISIEASGVHRSLGVKVSYVQSTTLDAWKPLHLRMMELGGNRRFEEFMREQGLPEDMPIREKYSTRAGEWYRRSLRAMAEGTEMPDPLPSGTGHLPAIDCTNSTKLVLDKVFAAPCAGDSAPRGEPRSRRDGGRRHSRFLVSAAAAGSNAVDASRKGASKRSADQKSVGQSLFASGSWPLGSEWLFSLESPRMAGKPISRLTGHFSAASTSGCAARRLKAWSTGTMEGFGSEDLRLNFSTGQLQRIMSDSRVAVTA